MKHPRAVLITLFFLVSTSSCEPGGASLAGQEVFAKYEGLRIAVEAYVNLEDKFVDGEWQEHWGDGSLFGPLYDLSTNLYEPKAKHWTRATTALEANRERVLNAAPNLSQNLDDLETLSMSTLSLIEAGAFVDNSESYRLAVDEMLIGLESLAELYKDYLDIDAGEFAANTYGPTALTAFLATVYISYAQNYPDYNQPYYLERAMAVLDRIDDKVWDGERQVYRFAPGDERLMLYPNITVMAALVRVYQLSGEAKYWERFKETYQGIQALKDEDGDHYHSPYSKESMGATDDDYTTHSSQNYLMLGLLVAFQVSGEESYLREIDTLLGFLDRRLLVGDQILHHWIDGRAAAEPDPYIYCLGCNVQTLFILYQLALL